MGEFYEKAIEENQKVKADSTDGMNKLDEMDLEMPEGLAFQMGMNQRAMKNFSSMSVEERKRVMDVARQTAAKEDMTQLVDRLATNSFQG